MNFKSDNVVPVSAEIMQAILKANQDTQASYGGDDYSILLQKKLSETFEKDALVYTAITLKCELRDICLSRLCEEV